MTRSRQVPSHNHKTFDVRPLGECRSCDNFHERQGLDTETISRAITRAERATLVLDVQKRLGCQKTSKQNCWKHGGYWNGECHRAAEIADLELRSR